MKIAFGSTLATLLAALAWLALAQDKRPPGDPSNPDAEPPRDQRLPNGKSQRDEILKAEHTENLKDAAQLVTLSQQVQLELDKNDRYVLSLSTLKKTDAIEKLAKRISSRMRHN